MEDSPYCSFHPREPVVGVCAHCLKDRLLAVSRDSAGGGLPPPRRRTPSSISLPKVFALGSFLLQLLDSRHHHHHADEEEAYSVDTTSVASLDDSFISIKFEDNGKATWDKAAGEPSSVLMTTGGGGNKTTAAAAPVVRSSSSSSTTAAVVAVKRGGVTRWRKQVVGRLLQLARWKRSAGGATVVGMDGKKAPARGRDWIRSLTRRRTGHGR